VSQLAVQVSFTKHGEPVVDSSRRSTTRNIALFVFFARVEKLGVLAIVAMIVISSVWPMEATGRMVIIKKRHILLYDDRWSKSIRESATEVCRADIHLLC
jgi:hypothetical protein